MTHVHCISPFFLRNKHALLVAGIRKYISTAGNAPSFQTVLFTQVIAMFWGVRVIKWAQIALGKGLRSRQTEVECIITRFQEMILNISQPFVQLFVIRIASSIFEHPVCKMRMGSQAGWLSAYRPQLYLWTEGYPGTWLGRSSCFEMVKPIWDC